MTFFDHFHFQNLPAYFLSRFLQNKMAGILLTHPATKKQPTHLDASMNKNNRRLFAFEILNLARLLDLDLIGLNSLLLHDSTHIFCIESKSSSRYKR